MEKELIKLDVPYFKQTRFSTCGPAALMMVMKYWDNSIELSRKFENKIWINSNPVIFFGGTLQFGLSKTASKMGFKVEIYQKTKISDSRTLGLLPLIEKNFIRKLKKLKIKIHYQKDIFVIIFDLIKKDIPPIVFVNLKEIIDENVLHWLVVTGYDENNIFVNDPYIPYGFSNSDKKNYPVNIDVFKKAISTDLYGNLRLPPCVISVYK